MGVEFFVWYKINYNPTFKISQIKLFRLNLLTIPISLVFSFLYLPFLKPTSILKIAKFEDFFMVYKEKVLQKIIYLSIFQVGMYNDTIYYSDF